MAATPSPGVRAYPALLVAALAVAGAELLLQWGRAWSVSPDLGWGWAVAALTGYFLWVRWTDRPPPREWAGPAVPLVVRAAAVAAALTLLPLSRLLLEPFPGWPLAQWLHGSTVIGIILVLVASAEGVPRARHFAWPLVFSLSALPWPAFITQGAIGHLRIGLSSLVAEILNLCGEPAIATGTVIEVGPGLIGIDEACGGIRSLQTAVIVALAIGELRRDKWPRRLSWLGAGIGVALLANMLRIGTLCLICSRAGRGAFVLWHDRVGDMEMIFTLGVLALLAIRAGIPPPPPAGPAGTAPRGMPHGATSLAVLLIAAIVATEAGTLAWFGIGDRESAGTPRWTAHLPARAPSFTASEFTPAMQELLQCDAHDLGRWRDSSGARRAGFVLEWHKGHVAQYAIRLHNPDICLALSGSELLATRPPIVVKVGALELPFAVREFRRGSQVYHVYFLPWNVSSGRPLPIVETPGDSSLSWFDRQWSEVRARRRNLEAREVAIAIFDAADTIEADQAFRAQMMQIIHSD